MLTGIFKDTAVDFAASQIVKNVDAQVDAGVYALEAGRLEKLKGSRRRVDQMPTADGPILVLLHGTFVDTESTFPKALEVSTQVG